jgi:hypothetical protein
MDLIEEYLRVVAALLPRGQREDIVAELRDLILTRKEAREEELGRPLTPDETEAVLREIGHPLVVAARYGEGPQHVVGPMLYPYWLFGVKAILALEAVIALVVLIVGTIGYGDPAAALGRAIAVAVSGGVTLIGVATIAAWIIERYGLRIDYLDNWRVKDLGPLAVAGDWGALRDWPGWTSGRKAGAQGRRPPPDPRRPEPSHRDPSPPYRPRHHGPAAQGVALIVWAAFLMWWWIGGFHILGPRGLADLRPAFDPGPLASADWGALKAAVFWPVLAYGLAILLQGAVLAAWPRQVRVHGLVRILTGAALLSLVVWLWNAPPLAPSVQAGSAAEFVSRTIWAFSLGPPFPLPAAIALVLVFAGFGAVCGMVQGLVDALLPCRWGRRGAPMGGQAASS